MILPLRAVLFQLFFLWVAIAIESFVLHKQLRLSKRTSLEYAAILNLGTTIVGWLLLFYIESVLPNNLRIILINFIFFNQVSGSTYLWLGITGLILFFINWVIKNSGFDLLFSLAKVRSSSSTPNLQRSNFEKPVQQHFVSSNTASVLLQAQAISHSAILLIFAAQLWILK